MSTDYGKEFLRPVAVASANPPNNVTLPVRLRQISILNRTFGLRPQFALCYPSTSGLSTSGKREKAVIG